MIVIPKRSSLGLTLVRLLPPSKSITGRWNYRGLYRCNLCGTVVDVARDFAKRKRTCGCFHLNTKHGHSKGGDKSNLYRRWVGMKERCLNPNSTSYSLYGGRGIGICPEWHQFRSFAEWSEASGFKPELEIDRVDVNGNYEPANCRWITPQANVHNRRVTRLSYEVTHAVKILNAAGLPPSSIARITSISRDAVARIVSGDIWKESHATQADLDVYLKRLRAGDRNIQPT